jgi:hypothetical protein
VFHNYDIAKLKINQSSHGGIAFDDSQQSMLLLAHQDSLFIDVSFVHNNFTTQTTTINDCFTCHLFTPNK